MEQSHLKFKCQQIIVNELTKKPYVGFESTDIPSGWKYDIKRWSSPFDLVLPSLPKLLDPSTQGVKESEYFKSGVCDKSLGDLYVKKITKTNLINKSIWTPVVEDGSYYRFKTPFYYYSDNSIVQYINKADNRGGRNYLELNSIPKLNAPILASSFKREILFGTIDYRIKFNQCYSFTGLYSNGEQLTTVTDSGKIHWDNVNPLKKEFILDRSIDGLARLFFNRDYVDSVGVEVNSLADLAACEQLGASTGSGHYTLEDGTVKIFVQSYYLKNFPVFDDNSFHLYVSDGTTYTELTRVSSWWDLVFDNLPDRYFVDRDLGIVYFASENPLYLPEVGNEIFASYDINLRIEYEPENETNEIVAWKADVNPITQNINQGFICITHENLEPASISLSIDKPLLQANGEYGPIKVGIDYATLIANVKSVSGINLSNIPVTFEMIPSTIGSLNGGATAYSLTDGRGNAYTGYQPPNSSDSMGFYSTLVRDCTNPTYSGYRELVISSLDPGLLNQEENCYLYQVEKDDIVLGYKTLSDFLDDLYVEQSPAWVVDAATRARWDSETTLKYDLKDFVEPSIAGEKINGRKVIVYKINNIDNFDNAAINPITGNAGAVMPVYPVLIEEIQSSEDVLTAGLWRVIYPSGSLPDCGPAETIAGYWLVSTRRVSFQAHCWSPYYNKEIYSNIVNARITFPDHMLGVYTNESGEKIPFGWKIITDTDNVASAINGVTFITINPSSGPYPILDLVNNNPSTEYADAPYRTVGFQFKLNSPNISLGR